MSELPEKKLIRPDEVARYFRVSTRTVYGWIDSGQIKAVRIAGGKLLRIKREDIEEAQKDLD